MKVQFLLKHPLILLTAIAAMFVIGLGEWFDYQDRSANSAPWRVSKVDSGSNFTVIRDGEKKAIKLCGITATGDKSREFVQSVINLGNGTVELEREKDSYEAWVILKPGYNVKLVEHISDVPDELVNQEIHLKTWLIERGYAHRDPQMTEECRDSEHLVWAEELAKKR
jgi:hypothetical protein